MFVRFLCCMLRPSPSYSFLSQHASYWKVISVQRCKRCTFGSPGLASAYPGLCVQCGGQRRRCCAFSAWKDMIKCRGIRGTTPTALLLLTANDPGQTTLSLVNPGLSKVQRLQRCDFYKYQILIYCMGIMLLILYFSSLTTNKIWCRIVQIT